MAKNTPNTIIELSDDSLPILFKLNISLNKIIILSILILDYLLFINLNPFDYNGQKYKIDGVPNTTISNSRGKPIFQ